MSEISGEYEGQFKREFIVSDNNGNTAFYAAYSKDKYELDEFVENTEFSLTTNDVNVDIKAIKMQIIQCLIMIKKAHLLKEME